ncbi:hypothetical protein KIK84_13075 [Curvibacter sp. CHRR-16]|uniref:hypothetical protein n=1 Tax=Curvibacter sp. CHRR-16 TaxID=2835872 RepID=UPI001BDA8937|nr:hypothetical protein [Curvibacter sp. CHRR-16]MBT0571260.1 hypothetical protein [Curvibacter sp. CHRR-16]
MGLKADFDEVTQHWDRSPWRVKVFLSVALFLATSSLASLSEVVFKWKGFVLDALVFYRSNLSQPVAELLTKVFAHTFPENFVDCAVLLGLFHGALIRALLLRRGKPLTRISDLGYLVFSYLGMLYLTAKPTVPATSSIPTKESSVWILYPAFVVLLYLLTKGAERILAMSYMLIPVVGVGIIAAVSAGLAR